MTTYNPDGVSGLDPAPANIEFRYVAATTSPDMTVQVLRELAAIIAANPSARLVNLKLSGGGAGAVFTTQIAFDPNGTATQYPLVSDSDVAFVAAGEPSALVSETARVLANAVTQSKELTGQDVVGAGNGAVFMAMLVFANQGTVPAGSGGILQAVTTGMEEQQDFAGGGLQNIEKEATSNPGVRLQCEFPSVQSTSSLRFSFVVQTSVLSVVGAGAVHGAVYRPFVAFPDDAIPDIRITGVDLVRELEPIAFVPQGAIAWSFLWPISATTPFGGPPTGRVQYYCQAASGDAADTVRLPGTTGGGNFGCPTMSLEEIANIVVQ